jgi:hypothetical protein
MAQQESILDQGSNPYSLFVFAINSPETKVKYVARLKGFFDFLELKGNLHEQSKIFADKAKTDSQWALGALIKYLQANKERVDKKRIKKMHQIHLLSVPLLSHQDQELDLLELCLKVLVRSYSLSQTTSQHTLFSCST